MRTKALNILITTKADGDEESIYKYISKKFGKVYADKFRIKLIDLFKALALRPFSGRPAKNSKSLRVFVFNRQNKVVYKTTSENLVIVRILNTRTKAAIKY